VLNSEIDTAEAERQTLAFLAQWVPAGASPMCGNSICQDRRFLWRGMPQLEAFFHYRNLDVSTDQRTGETLATGNCRRREEKQLTSGAG
jgi:oligoribonuclease